MQFNYYEKTNNFKMFNSVDNKTNRTKSSFISAKGLLEFLTDKEREELLENKMVVEFDAGETIIKEGFVASNIMYVDEGLVKLDVSTGRQISTVSLMSSDSFIGIICTFAGRNLSFSAMALEKTTISLFDIDLFEKFIRQNGEFAFQLIRHTSAMTSQIVHHISKFSHKNINGALSILLCDFSEIYKSNSFTLPVNRKEMASMLGYSKESVINTLSKFNKEGILNVRDKNIEILDMKMLKQIGEIG